MFSTLSFGIKPIAVTLLTSYKDSVLVKALNAITKLYHYRFLTKWISFAVPPMVSTLMCRQTATSMPSSPLAKYRWSLPVYTARGFSTNQKPVNWYRLLLPLQREEMLLTDDAEVI